MSNGSPESKYNKKFEDSKGVIRVGRTDNTMNNIQNDYRQHWSNKHYL